MQSLAQNFKHENFYWNIAFHWRLTCACVCVCVLAYGLAFTIVVFLNRSISRCPFSHLLFSEHFYCLMNEDALLVIQPYRDLSFLTAFRICLSLSHSLTQIPAASICFGFNLSFVYRHFIAIYTSIIHCVQKFLVFTCLYQIKLTTSFRYNTMHESVIQFQTYEI